MSATDKQKHLDIELHIIDSTCESSATTVIGPGTSLLVHFVYFQPRTLSVQSEKRLVGI